MNRRDFFAAGAGLTLAGTGQTAPVAERQPALMDDAPWRQDDIRAAFPRLADEHFVNAAGGTPLGRFAEDGINRYLEFVRLGPGRGRGDYFAEMMSNIRGTFGRLIGADAAEIALVHCTKEGEQIVIDGLDLLGRGGNIVTNDLHFSGSLHNLVGLQRAGVDVRIVKNRDWDVPIDWMVAAIDDRTRLVAITLVSNVNGRIEPIRQLAEAAHAHGAYVYADVIQAAGIFPFDVREMGIDFAAANGYKWLLGVHGSGFLYVRRELQGAVLPDRLFPGHVTATYPPWTGEDTSGGADYVYQPPRDASRYEPGHHSYVGYCAVYEGMRFVERIGVANALSRSVRLNIRIRNALDPDRYDCISPHADRSPIISFAAKDPETLEPKLRARNVTVALLGNGRFRISPAVYNTERDIDALIAALNADP